jgi:hypothetical protein
MTKQFELDVTWVLDQFGYLTPMVGEWDISKSIKNLQGKTTRIIVFVEETE